MNRLNLWLAGLQVLTLVAIGWLWSENQSLRTPATDGSPTKRNSAPDPATREGRTAAHREIIVSRTPGARDRNFEISRPNTRVKEPETGPRQRVPALSQGTARAGKTGSEEKNLPVDEATSPEAGGIAPPQPGVDPLIVNGGFDGELSPWLCEQGRVIPDPADGRNSLLEVTLGESGFRLSQSFEPPAGKVPMTLSFRARVSGEIALSGFSVLLHGRDDQPLLQTFVDAGKQGEWKTITLKAPTPLAPASLRIESSRGEGVIWIDDVRLERSTAVPAPPEGQPSP